MTTILFPGRYLQGPAMLQALPAELQRLGGAALLMLDDFAARSLVDPLQQLLAKSGLFAGSLSASGANSEANAERHAVLVAETGARVVVGVGGGKVMDAAKATAERANCPLVLIPSSASTDAPCSSVAVMQDDAGRFSHYAFLRRSPDVVLVDSQIIALAPQRLLVAGFGDALSTWFEAQESVEQAWPNIAGGRPSNFALAVARQCYEAVLADAHNALAELCAGVTGAAFERVVEANILLSGIGFESGGLGTAHAIQNGLSALPQCRGVMHGELVTLGLLAMLRLRGAEDPDFVAVRRFADSIGLPVKLADVGLAEVSDDILLDAARFACTPAPMNRVAAGITPQALLAALRALV